MRLLYARPMCGHHDRTWLRMSAMVTLAAMLVLPAGLGRSSMQVMAFLGVPASGAYASVPGHLVKTPRTLSRAEEIENVVDAELLGEQAVQEAELERGAYPPEAYADYEYTESPPKTWFDRTKIDRHRVNSKFFDMFKKPKNFFPHKLQPGDTVRVYYRDPMTGEDQKISRAWDIKSVKTTYFDGVILNFKGDYHARNMRLRAMLGKGTAIMGAEMVIPIHSPLVEQIVVLRRGYIGRNKNAYFMRGMIGRKNVIPLDKERTEMDKEFRALIEGGRADEIPDSEYPQQEWDRYPLPKWKQDEDDWDEENYKAENVDQRSEYERRVIGDFRMRPPGPRGKAASR